MNKSVLFAGSLTVSAVLVAALATLLFWQPQAVADTEVLALTERLLDPSVQRWGFLAAAAATTIGALGAAYAVATIGGASIGALTEKPELFGRVLILVGLAEGIAIYGLIVSVLILNKI
jgi:V/A-type H+-transporting ATPase subunit K